jgi:hypothetical protein
MEIETRSLQMQIKLSQRNLSQRAAQGRATRKTVPAARLALLVGLPRPPSAQ